MREMIITYVLQLFHVKLSLGVWSQLIQVHAESALVFSQPP